MKNIQGQHPLFNQFWELYPKKANKYSASKAFSAMMEMESGLAFDRLLECVKIYHLTHNPLYYKDAGNWLRQDHWKDFYYEDDLNALLLEWQDRSAMADQIIKDWNTEADKFKWWHYVQAVENRKLQVVDALKNKFFKQHWPEALSLVAYLFKKPIVGADWRANLRPSIEWFIKDDTVPRLVEGHYGRRKRPKKQINTSNALGIQRQVEVDADAKSPISVRDCLNDFYDQMGLPKRKPKNPFLK